MRFEAYGGSKIYPVGKFRAVCEKNNTRAEQEFYVCKNNVALLGLESIVKFNVVHINDNMKKPIVLVQETQ